MPELLAAIDQGTTSTRCIVFDPQGTVLGASQREHRQITPQPGWVEHDPREILAATEAVVAGALEAAGLRGADLAAVGITNQRETVCVWDRESGAPLANAIVWQDTRTAALCRELGGEAGPDRFRRETGLPLATYFSGPKLRWLLEENPAVREAAAAGRALAGTIDSFLVWHLTGGPRGGRHVTDVSNASRTLLARLETGDFDEGLCEALGVPRTLLPEVAASADPEAYGTTRADGPFGATVPIGAVLGDQQAALFGQACFRAGEAKCTFGTGAFLLVNTGERPVLSRHGLLTTVAWKLPGAAAVFALEGSVAVAGALIQWLRDQLGLVASASEIEPLARQVPDSGGVTIVPAFSGLFAPRWRDDARGVICGLTRFSDKRHLARAALEATALQVADVLEAAQADAGLSPPALRVDGGMTANELLLEIQADVLGIGVVRSRVAETTALGAAWAAGLAVGVVPDTAALAARWSAGGEFAPRADEASRRELRARWERAVERSLGWARP